MAQLQGHQVRQQGQDIQLNLIIIPKFKNVSLIQAALIVSCINVIADNFYSQSCVVHLWIHYPKIPTTRNNKGLSPSPA